MNIGLTVHIYQYVFSSTVYWVNLGVAPPQKWLSEFQSCCCFLSTIFLNKERLFQAWAEEVEYKHEISFFCMCAKKLQNAQRMKSAKEYQNYDKKNLQSIDLSSHWCPTQGQFEHSNKCIWFELTK